MAAVRWTLAALEDLEAACEYIALDSPLAAAHLNELAFAATDRLGEFPRSGRVVPEARREDIREIFVWGYRIVYLLSGDLVVVLTVHHGARLLDEIPGVPD